MTNERKPLVLRLEPDLMRKVERLTRRSRKEMGGSWSRNDQICWMLKVYEAPEDDMVPANADQRGRPARFAQLRAGATPTEDEKPRYEELLRWERRSDAAKRAVQTKRAKYKTWPTRKGDHR